MRFDISVPAAVLLAAPGTERRGPGDLRPSRGDLNGLAGRLPAGSSDDT